MRALLLGCILLSTAVTAEPLRVVHTGAYAPYEFVGDDGEVQGYLIDLFHLWSQTTGREIRFIELPWADCKQAILDGRADVITAMTPTAERRHGYAFARQVARAESRIFTHRSLPVANRPEELAGLLVGVVAGDRSDDQLAREVPSAERRPYPDYRTLCLAAREGEVRIIMGTSAVIYHHLTGLGGLGDFSISDQAVNSDPMAPAVAAGRTELLAELNAGFARIPAAEWERLARHWVPYTLDPEAVVDWPTVLHWSLVAGLAVIALCAAFLLWQWQLRRQVQRATGERDRAAAGERAALHRLQAVLDAASEVAVIAADQRGRIRVFNRGAERLLGLPVAQAVEQKHLLDCFARSELEARLAPRSDLFAALCERAATTSEAEDWTWQGADGERRQVALFLHPVETGGEGRGLLVVARDVGRERELERQLRHSQKLEALGQLAGGVAHDFNNMLGGIMGYAEQLLLGEDDPAVQRRQRAEAIVTVAERAARLNRQLLAFASNSDLDLQPCDLHQVIEDGLTLLRRTLDPRIELIPRLKADKSWVRGDEALLENVLLNLGINARDAMPEGGRFVVSTENVCFDERGAAAIDEGLTPGDHILMQVSDSGCGIPREIQERVFDPFFTTKPLGKGTGLGLSAVHGLVHDHGGGIDLYSEPGYGTSFRIYLPCCPAKPEAEGGERPPATGSGGILVIDDDDMVRDLAVQMLRHLGYTVFAAVDGLTGVDTYRQHRAEIDLVLLDMLMPGIPGPEALAALQAVNPHVKVMVCSGIAGDDSLSLMREAGVLGVLPKPYRARELARRVAEALGEPVE